MKNGVIWKSSQDGREQMEFEWEEGWDQPILDAFWDPGLLDTLKTLSSLILPTTLQCGYNHS